mmetsp:Transcript_46381/g.110469  ORF Transcript_46381/g.110469 Transcript_46381/m.110469 type:complete len:293 (-) Transcript_46381:69-947(-)
MGALVSVHLQLVPLPAGTRLLGGLYLALSCGLSRLPLKNQLHFLSCLATVLPGWSTRGLVKPTVRPWPLVTAMLYKPVCSAMDFVMALLELNMAAEYLPRRERELGSARLLLWSALATAGSNVMFLSLMAIRRHMGTAGVERSCSQGLWPIIAVATTLQALDHPDRPVNIMGFRVQGRWYPLSLAVILSAFQGAVQWETFAAIAFGHVSRLLNLEVRALPKASVMASFERRWLAGLTVLLERLTGGEWLPPPGSRRSGPPSAQDHLLLPPQGLQREEESFHLFGGQGHRLGT